MHPYFVLMAAILFACLGLSIGLNAKTLEIKPKYPLKKVAALSFFLGVIYLCVHPLFVEYADKSLPAGVVVSFDRNGKVESVSRTAVWCWSRCANMVRYSKATGSVSPITENPKLRKLTYELKVSVFDFDRFFGTIGIKAGSSGETHEGTDEKNVNEFRINGAVTYQIYEFNNAYLQELAKFYNPQDAAQREKLDALVKSYFNPRLEAKGIKIEKVVSFTVE